MIDNKDLQNVLNAIGAVIEISAFIYRTMMKNGFPEDESYTVAHDFILERLSPNSDEQDE